MTKLRSKLILLSESFYILRKREANENKKSLKEEDIKKFMNKLLFSNWNQIITLIENFLTITESQANAIKNLKRVKQDS